MCLILAGRGLPGIIAKLMLPIISRCGHTLPPAVEENASPASVRQPACYIIDFIRHRYCGIDVIIEACDEMMTASDDAAPLRSLHG